MRLISAFILAFGLAHMAAADEPELRDLIECTPGKSFSKMAGGLADLDDDKLDTINTNPSFTLEAADGGEMPERIFIRSGETDINLDVSDEGEVADFINLFLEDEKAELCVEDPSRAGKPKEKGAFSMAMKFNMNFIDNNGTYPLPVLKDGLKDGKSALKKMMPGPVSLLIPKLSHIYIEYEDDMTEPSFRALDGDQDLGEPGFVKFGPAFLIAYEDLKDMDADTLKVLGGAHTISPSLSPKRMAKLMGEPETEE